MSYARRLSRSKATAVAILLSAAAATLGATVTALVIRPVSLWPPLLGAAVGARALGDSPWGAPWEALAGSPDTFTADGLTALTRTVGQVGAAALLIGALSLVLFATSRVLSEWRALAVRCALGARLRPLLALVGGELLLLGALGCTAGLLVGGLTAGALRGAWPTLLVRPGYVVPVLAGAAAVAGAVALLLGTVALGLLAPLQRGGVRTVADLHGDHVTAPRALLDVQNALVVLLLAGLLVVTYAFVLIRGDAPVSDAVLPYPDSMAVVPLTIRGRGADVPAARAATYRALLDTLNQAGVRAAITSPDAWAGLGKRLAVFSIAPSLYRRQLPVAQVRVVAASPGALTFMGLLGRRGDFTPGDTLGAPLVAVLSNVASSRVPGGVVRTGFRREDAYVVRATVSGIAPGGLGASGGPLAMMYVSLLQHPPVVAETTLRADDLPRLRAIVAARKRGEGPRPVLGDAVPLRERLRELRAPLPWFARLTGVLAISATLVGALGLAAVMTQVVTLRRRDIAVRLAIGALPHHIETWLVGKALRLTLAGVLVGVSVARWVGWLMRDEAAHREAGDLFVLGALILAFAPLGIVSCWLPGRRASRIAPAEVWADPRT